MWVKRRRVFALDCLTLASYTSAAQEGPCCEKYRVSPYIIIAVAAALPLYVLKIKPVRYKEVFWED